MYPVKHRTDEKTKHDSADTVKRHISHNTFLILLVPWNFP